jgi:hypothetical protein
MKIVVDEKKLARNAKVARAVVLGVVLAAIGLMIAVLLLQTTELIRDYANALLVAQIVIIVVLFAVSRIGFGLTNRYLAHFRPEKVLRESLKGLDRKFALMLFQKPTDYLLIEPGGITVLIPRNQEGKIGFAKGKWQFNRGLLRAWMGRDEVIGDPLAEATSAMTAVKKLLDAKAPEIKVPIRAAIVFTNPNAALTAEPAPVAVLRADALKDFIRVNGKLTELPKSIQRKMRDALGAPELSSE